jgi:hypothetical protein
MAVRDMHAHAVQFLCCAEAERPTTTGACVCVCTLAELMCLGYGAVDWRSACDPASTYLGLSCSG